MRRNTDNFADSELMVDPVVENSYREENGAKMVYKSIEKINTEISPVHSLSNSLNVQK